MRGRTLLMVLLLSATLLAGCTDGEDDGTGAPTDGAGSRDLSGFSADAPCDVPASLPEARFPTATFNTSHGDIVIDLHYEMVPITVQNFIDLAEAGEYDGTPFHRIITDFMMQGGDITNGDGTGGHAADGGSIPDEFHRLLRHDQKGVLSMANSGPNTGGSQFFITFGPTPHLDDKHSIFGQVSDGMDVLDRVNEEAASSDGTPKEEVTLDSVTIEYPDRVTTPAFGAELWSPDAAQPVPQEGGWTRFAVVVENLANHHLPVCIEAEAVDGVTTRIETDLVQLDVPARQRIAFVVDVELADDAADAVTVPVTASTVAGQEVARIDLEVTKSADVHGPAVEEGDTVEAHYIGMTVDGRIFDTSVEEVATYADENDLGYSTFQKRPQYDSFSFTPGSGVIEGFTELAVGTPEGGTTVDRIPPEKAYGASCPPGGQCPPLAGRTLLFQLEILGIE